MRPPKAPLSITNGIIAIFVLMTAFAFAQGIDEDELEFRFWRNLETGTALSAAVIAVDKTGTQIQLYKKGGEKIVVKIADFHEEDKTYVKEWQAWKVEQEKRAVQNAGTSDQVQDASEEITKAITMRVEARETKGDTVRLGSSKEFPSEHEITVQIGTRKDAPKLPPGELHVVVFIGDDLTDARMRGSKAEGARDQKSKSFTEKKQKVEKIASFVPGQSKDFKFKADTKQIKGEGSQKKGKKSYKFDWKHDQSIIGIRARLIIGGKLAAEVVTPADLDKRVDRYSQ